MAQDTLPYRRGEFTTLSTVLSVRRSADAFLYAESRSALSAEPNCGETQTQLQRIWKDLRIAENTLENAKKCPETMFPGTGLIKFV